MKTLHLASQVLSLAAVSADAFALRLTPEFAISAIFALGLGLVAHADYSRRPRQLSTALSTRRRTEALTLAA